MNHKNNRIITGRKGGNQDRGFVLITSFLLIMVMEIFSVALFSRFQVYLDAVERNKNKMVSFHMAEAAIDATFIALKSSTSYSGASYASFGNNGGYAVNVCPPTCTGLTQPTDSSVRLIQATGYAPNNTTSSIAYETRTILSYADIDDTPWLYAAYGETSVDLNGSPVLVDSYSSSSGAYGGANVASNGDIASDGTITQNGHPTINGDLITNPDVSCHPGTTSTASSGALSLTVNSTLTLAAGTYHYSSITISGNGKLTTTGAVTIYADGTVSIAGNGVATSGNTPANLSIIATGSSTISISGSADFYGTIYAPDSSVNNNAGDFYGAIIAGDYDHNGNGDLHYDESLQNITGPCVDVTMLSWQEQNKTLT